MVLERHIQLKGKMNHFIAFQRYKKAFQFQFIYQTLALQAKKNTRDVTAGGDASLFIDRDRAAAVLGTKDIKSELKVRIYHKLSYMCTRFFLGGGGVKFVEPIIMDNFFQKKKSNFFSKKMQKKKLCVFFFKNEKKSSISSKLCILLLLCPIMI
jgi:hypothetical protein